MELLSIRECFTVASSFHVSKRNRKVHYTHVQCIMQGRAIRLDAHYYAMLPSDISEIGNTNRHNTKMLENLGASNSNISDISV